MNIHDLDFEDVFKELGIDTSGSIEDIKKIMKQDLKELMGALDRKRNAIALSHMDRKEDLSVKLAECIERLKQSGVNEDELASINDEIRTIQTQLEKLELDIKQISIAALAQINKFNTIKQEIEVVDSSEQALRKCVIIRKLFLMKKNADKLTDSDEDRRIKRENRIKYSAISEFLDGLPSYTDYINERNMVLNNMDWENRDLSAYEYDESVYSTDDPFSYSMKIFTKPESLNEGRLDSEDIHILDFGDLQFSFMKSPDGIYHKKGLPYKLLGVIRKDEQGTTRVYHGFIYTLGNIAPEFYQNVVFSNLAMRNAKNNNFGYIGNIEKISDGNGDFPYKLGFNELNICETIEAASFALTHEGRCNVAAIQTLSDAYDYMDRSMLNMLSRMEKNTEDNELKKTEKLYGED